MTLKELSGQLVKILRLKKELEGLNTERFEKITEAVNSVDPVGLLAFGAPPDEYSPECEIMAMLPEKDLSAQIIYAIFYHFFGDMIASSDADCWTHIYVYLNP
jgi:hypothetical protein